MISPMGSNRTDRSTSSTNPSRRSRPTQSSAATPIGRLTRKMDGHPQVETSNPPTVGPSAGPRNSTSPAEVGRSLVSPRPKSRFSDNGTSGAAATPCNPRAAMSSGAFWATAQAADVNVKAARLHAYIRTVPNRRPRYALAGSVAARASRYPETGHWTVVSGAPSCWLMSGTATFTTLLSIIDSSEPDSRTNSATGESRGLADTFASGRPGHRPVDVEQALIELAVAGRIAVLQPGHDGDVRGGDDRLGRPAAHDPVRLDRAQLLLGGPDRHLVPAGRDVGELGLPGGVTEQKGEPVRVGPRGLDQVAQSQVARLVGHVLTDAGDRAIEYRLVQLALAGEVAVEQQLADVGHRRDLLHRGRRIATLGERRRRPVQDAARRLLAAVGHRS